MKMNKKLKKGFTLVELVVVIAVIAILAGVSVGAYFGITESANQSKADQEAKQLHTALMLIVNTPDNSDAAIWSESDTFKIVDEETLEEAILEQVSYAVDVQIAPAATTEDEEVDYKAIVVFDSNPATKFTYSVIGGKSATLDIKTGSKTN